MKKTSWQFLFFTFLFAGTLLFSLIFASADSSSDYFSVERKLMRYSTSVQNPTFKAYLEVTTGQLGTQTKDWEKNFAEQPKAEWLYTLSYEEGAKYQPLVDTDGQGYAFVLDTLYYVNADGFIVAMEVATRTETPLFQPEGRVKAMQATVDLLFYECAGQLYRYHIPSGQRDFFMTLPSYSYFGWEIVSNQTVKFSLNWEYLWYNREEGQYYSSYTESMSHHVAKGEEGMVPPEFAAEGTPFDGDDIALHYESLLRRVPGGSYNVGKVTFDNVRHGEFTRSDLDILRAELNYLGLIDVTDSIWDIEEGERGVGLPAATVRDVYESAFGKGSFASLMGKDLHDVTQGYFLYDEETDEYRYICHSYGGGDPAVTGRSACTKVEEKDGSVVIYRRDAMISQQGVLFYTGSTCLVGNDAVPFAIGRRNPDNESEQQPDKMLERGEFDEYLPLYKITFLENEDGSYRWESTELVEEGKPIPESCFAEVPLKEGKKSHDAYFASQAQLIAAPLGSANAFWTEVVLLTEENVAEWQSKIYPDSDQVPQLGFWVYGRTRYSNKFYWQYHVGGAVYGAFGYLRYYVYNGVLYESDMDSGLGSVLHLVGDGVEEIKAFRDLIFFRQGNKIYRCYLPDNTLKEVAILPAGAAWEPVSNRVIRFESADRTYWYDTETKAESTSYDGPEILTVKASQIAGLDAGNYLSQLPNTDSASSTTDSEAQTDTSATDVSVDSLTDSVTDSVGEPAEESDAPLWPWIAGGALLLLGVSGVAAWFFVHKKKNK